MKILELSLALIAQLRFQRFYCSGRMRGLRYKVGKKNRAFVPLRNGGSGQLLVIDRNSFGFNLAAKLGDGSILLQPRNPGSVISIGSKNSFSNNISIISTVKIAIGDHCRIGDAVSIIDSDFHEIDPVFRGRSQGVCAPVVIGNNVWIGSRALILKGVTIGDNSVIGAMSVVTKSVPENCIVAGNPAKFIQTIDAKTV